MAQIATTILSSLTALGDVIVVVLLVSIAAFLLGKKQSVAGRVVKFFGKYALYFSLIVASTATLGSLFYSEVAGYEPCKLCWIQRIFMYPQMLLLGIATWKNDRKIADYLLPLSAIGLGFSSYHYYLQRNPEVLAPCSVVGFSLGCSQQFVMSYGYITIPMMALTAFSMIGLFLLASKLTRAR